MSQQAHDGPVATSGIHDAPGRSAATHDRVAPGDIAVGVVLGRASEYFDFFVYGIASVLVFPSLFFPFVARAEGTLYAFGLFALAFVVRPLGTVAGMALQRRFSRGTKMTVALFLLGCSTVSMALLPSYASWGGAAIALLALCRAGQGLALGASWDGMPSLLALNAPAHRRGWYAMLAQLGAPLGFVVACGLFAYLWNSLGRVDFLSWGWRYPFFAAFAINVVALFARLRLVVTREYEREYGRLELEPCNEWELFRQQGGNVVLGAFAALASYALFHIVTIFSVSWTLLYGDGDQSIGTFLCVQLVGAVLAAVAMLVSGLLADRIGRRRTVALLAVLIAVFSVAVPWLLDGGALGQYLFVLIGFVLLGLSYGQSTGTMTANFWPRYRYTGAALTSDLAWLIGAAFAPLVALSLSERFGLIAVTLYLLSGCACTLLALRASRNLASPD